MSLALYPAMMLRDGTMARCVHFSVEQLDNKLPLITMWACESPRLDATFAVGGGKASPDGEVITRTKVKPREGLTWGQVAVEDDVVFDIVRKGFAP